jgi:hypothetical protein
MHICMYIYNVYARASRLSAWCQQSLLFSRIGNVDCRYTVQFCYITPKVRVSSWVWFSYYYYWPSCVCVFLCVFFSHLPGISHLVCGKNKLCFIYIIVYGYSHSWSAARSIEICLNPWLPKSSTIQSGAWVGLLRTLKFLWACQAQNFDLLKFDCLSVQVIVSVFKYNPLCLSDNTCQKLWKLQYLHDAYEHNTMSNYNRYIIMMSIHTITTKLLLLCCLSSQ